MDTYTAPLAHIRFLMNDVFQLPSNWQRWAAMRELMDAATADALLEEGAKVASQLIAPLNRSSDEEGCYFANGNVSTPTGYKAAYEQFAQGGWVGLAGNPEYGGMGVPKALATQFDEMVCGANLAFSLYPNLGAGACLAIDAHASDDIKQTYLPSIYAGQWLGTMCLTEAQCGTDLSLIRTKATDNGDGSYAITGSKIFISAGEHDLTENIIHLVLAKLPDAPKGAKGVSLFLVPKILVNEDGSLGEPNRVSCGSIEHKMGIHGSATCVMNFDGATGYLIDEPHQGLVAMFTMMNYERIFVGVQALGAAEASYQTALNYARERLQGRSPLGAQSPDKPADPLLVHGDVRRMLLTMKALNEAGRAFSTFTALQLDTAKYSDDAAEQQSAAQLAALLTPVVKAFITDRSFDACVLGQQTLGGHGYVREWGQEQRVRDVRITQIYEGTNGIQALDLLGRKIISDNAQVFEQFCELMEDSFSDDDEFAEPLQHAITRLSHATLQLMKQCKDDPRTLSAASVDYLNAFGYVVYGWMWHLMSKAAAGEDNVQQTARYYFKRLLPQFESHLVAALSGIDELFNVTGL